MTTIRLKLWQTVRRRVVLMCIGLALAVTAVAWLAATRSVAGTYVYPLKVSENKRYLVDQNNKPYFANVDTAWTLLGWVTDRAEVDAYLDARKAQGFNMIATCMTCWSAHEVSRGGVSAFTNGDLSQPNEAYFAFIDQIVQDAADRDMHLLVGPWWLGDNGSDDPGGVPSMQEWTSFGTYLGNRYKNYDNIIWFMGGDHQAQQGWDDTDDYTPLIDAMANGIRSVDTRHLITYHPSADTFQLGNKDWLAFYMYQQNQVEGAEWTYNRTKAYYTYGPTKPVINIEPPYEDHMSAYIERRNAWWSFLSGALGTAYGGARSAWFIGESGANKWQADVQNLPGAKQVGFVKATADGYQWQNLAPDYDYDTLTSGSGGNGADYSTAGRSPDGNLFMAYAPNGRTLSVDMGKFSAVSEAYWYDPGDGSQKSAGSNLANSGSKDFQTPGNNSVGDQDWVLVIATAAGIASGNSGGTPTATATPSQTAMPQPTTSATPVPTVTATTTPTATIAPTTSPTNSPVATASPANSAGDVNGDGKVDIADLTLLLTGWDGSPQSLDFNTDGSTNVYDLSILLSHWSQ